MNHKKFIVLLGFFLLCQSAGILGAVFTIESIPTWYAELEKPNFVPPNWIFGPAWITLYTLMSLAVFFIWEKRKSSNRAAFSLKIFFLHLILNALWTPMFFGAHQILAAFFIIVLLWGLILWLLFLFYPIQKKATWLLIPYFLWVSFAMILNGAFWYLNS